MTDWLAGFPDWMRGVAIIVAAALIGLAIHAIIYRAAEALARRRPDLMLLDGALMRHSRSGVRLLLPLLAMRSSLAAAAVYLTEEVIAALQIWLAILLVLAVTWLLIRLTRVIEEVAFARFDIEVADNLRARQIRTRVALLRRALVVLVAVVGLGLLLLQIPGFRAVGTGLLASAGIVGIIVGVAAQRPLANLLAGVQMALTQPIRVDDAVVIEGEWGWIEEITLTFVVVRIWDLRRLVVPISYFLEKPFQNWTRTSASILGSVFVYTDYTVPLDALRAELERVVHSSPLWDGEACVLQVTDLTERTMQLRALMSAANSGKAWDLRCQVREKLVVWLQQHHPSALPKVRLIGTAEVVGAAQGGRGSGESRPEE